MGEILGRGLGVPTLTVMEGGYAVDALGVNVSNLLQALEGSAG
jgi:acetoin utilization deacetylase AcuC-like enzyme